MTELVDYTIQGIFFVTENGHEFTEEQELGEIALPENATFQQMPQELEINGFIYKLET